MTAMARDGHDEEDGWTKLSRLEPEGIDVFERKVSWSQTRQLRSRWTASCALEKVGEYYLAGESIKKKLWDGESFFQSSALMSLRSLAPFSFPLLRLYFFGTHEVATYMCPGEKNKALQKLKDQYEAGIIFVHRTERQHYVIRYATIQAPWPVG